MVLCFGNGVGVFPDEGVQTWLRWLWIGYLGDAGMRIYQYTMHVVDCGGSCGGGG